MGQNTVRLLGIAPYEGMKLAMEREAAGRPGLVLDVRIGDLESGADIVRGIPGLAVGLVFIALGLRLVKGGKKKKPAEADYTEFKGEV